LAAASGRTPGAGPAVALMLIHCANGLPDPTQTSESQIAGDTTAEARIEPAPLHAHQQGQHADDGPELRADQAPGAQEHERSPRPSGEEALGRREHEHHQQRLGRAVQRGSVQVRADGEQHGAGQPRDPSAQAIPDPVREHQGDERADAHERKPQQRRRATQRRERRHDDHGKRLDGRAARHLQVTVQQLARPHHPRPGVVPQRVRHHERGGADDDRGGDGHDEPGSGRGESPPGPRPERCRQRAQTWLPWVMRRV
jgi:hypothetical protein